MTVSGRRCRWDSRLALLGIVCVIGGMGCANTRYSAVSLPPDLQAPPIENSQTVDLSNFSLPTAERETVHTGDVLEVTIAAGLDSSDTIKFPARVMENGTADLPVIGPVPLAGLEPAGAEAEISRVCMQRGLYRAPHVTVSIKDKRMNYVTVVGGVKKQGIYPLRPNSCDLLAALVAAEGLAVNAGTEVEIRRPVSATGGSPDQIADKHIGGLSTIGYSVKHEPRATLSSVKINLASAVTSGDGNFRLENGSIVTVEKRDPDPVEVLGLVNKPGRYEFPLSKELRVLGAIALASGVNSSVADKVYVIRRVEGHQPAVVQVSLRNAKLDPDGRDNLRLAPGDTVSVEHTPATVLLEAIQIIRFGVSTSLNSLFF